MIGFGDKLRREREMRGVSLEEIAESTKIGTRSLRALEDDDFDKLPGGIFNKGFVRAYSRFLGLNEDQTVSDFESAFKEYNVAHGQVEELPSEPEPEKVNLKAVWVAVAAVVFIAALAAAGYLLKRPATVSATQSQSAHDARTPAIISRAGSSNPSSSPTKASATPVTPPAPETKSIASNAVKSDAAGATGADSAPQSGNSKTDSAPLLSSNSVNSASPIRLEVFAREEAWLSVSADGRNLGQQLLAAQQSRTIHAQKEVHLKLGNVGGVEVSFNGKPVNIDGEPKQVKELTFTPDGLHQ